MKKTRPVRTEAEALATVQKNGMALMRIPNNLRTEEICLTAVEADGMALEFVPDALKTERLCGRAVWTAGDAAIKFVPTALQGAVQAAVNDAYADCDRTGVSLGPGVETPPSLLAAATAIAGATSDEEIGKILDAIEPPDVRMMLRIPDVVAELDDRESEVDDGPRP